MKTRTESKPRPANSTRSSTSRSRRSASTGTSEAGGAADEALLLRAHEGDESAAPEVRALLRRPESAALLKRAGDLAHIVESTWVARLAGKSVVVREAVLSELARLKADLAGPAPSPIQLLLIERVAACWVQVASVDAAEAAAQDRSIAQAEWASKRQSHAHKRFLGSVKTLAEVRRLMRPSVQVNIAEQQVNVGG